MQEKVVQKVGVVSAIHLVVHDRFLLNICCSNALQHTLLTVVSFLVVWYFFLILVPGKQRMNESLLAFNARIAQEKETCHVHDIVTMALGNTIELNDNAETLCASKYNGRMNDMILVKKNEGQVGEEMGKNIREHDLQHVYVRSSRPVAGPMSHGASTAKTTSGSTDPFTKTLSNTLHLLRSPASGSVGTLGCSLHQGRPRIGSHLKLLGWPIHEFTDTSTGQLSHLYDGSIFTADGNVLGYKDRMVVCDLTNFPGGSGGPALDASRNVVGVLSMGNDHVALVVPIEYGLSLVVPMLAAMRKKGSESSGGNNNNTLQPRITSAAELAAGIVFGRLVRR